MTAKPVKLLGLNPGQPPVPLGDFSTESEAKEHAKTLKAQGITYDTYRCRTLSWG